jgi:HK97 family phage prohead protease
MGAWITRTAFDETISAWRRSAKRLPLLFEHRSVVIGDLDPNKMQATEAGLLVVGEVDRDLEEGKRVWRAIKRGSMGFSIGYMAVQSRPRREGKGRVITEIDLLEVSATVTPMNAGTRTLGWKSLDPDERRRWSERERDAEFWQLTEENDRLVAARFAELERRPARKAPARRPRDGGSAEEDLFELIKREAEKAKRSLEARKAEAEAKHLAEKAAKAARPIQIASFEL